MLDCRDLAEAVLPGSGERRICSSRGTESFLPRECPSVLVVDCLPRFLMSFLPRRAG